MNSSIGEVSPTVLSHRNGIHNSPRGMNTYLEEKKKMKEELRQEREEEKRRDLMMLLSYNPWGKPGGGAPRKDGITMGKLQQNLEAKETQGSIVDTMSKPGGGAPIHRTDSGNPTGIIKVHADIRNNRKMLNEETRRREHGTNQPTKTSYRTDGTPYFIKGSSLVQKVDVDERVKTKLREHLEAQIQEKQQQQTTRRDAEHHQESKNKAEFLSGRVGHVSRDSSGKLRKSENISAVRAADGIIEYIDPKFKDKGIIEQLGRPGPGVPVRTESGNIRAQKRGNFLSNTDDPFRPQRSKTPIKSVFSVEIEDVAKQRAADKQRNRSLSPVADKHRVQNGYYTNGLAKSDGYLQGSTDHNQKKTRYNSRYLEELRLQMAEKQAAQQRNRRQSLEADALHVENFYFKGRPGNGAPLVKDGQVIAGRKYRINNLESHCATVVHPLYYRGGP